MARYPARTANNEAKRRLVGEYPERYREIQAEEYEKAGIELPKTDREKAQDQLQALAEKYPDLVTGLTYEGPHEPVQVDTGAPPAPEPNEPGIDDAELPEGHEFFGNN